MKLAFKIDNSNVTFAILFVYATSLSPFMDASFRNYLVICTSAASFLLLFSKKFRFGFDLLLVPMAISYCLLPTLIYGTSRDLQSLSYLSLFTMGYLALAAGVRDRKVTPARMEAFLAWLIKLFAIVALVQFASSLIGLPVLNQLATRGLLNHNSLASEPSNVGRIISLMMLTYLLLGRFQNGPQGLLLLVLSRKWVFLAFVVTIGLSGSTLAIMAAPLAVVLTLRLTWISFFAVMLILLWPTLLIIDFEPIQRAAAFLTSAQSLDLNEMAISDNSATIRVAPLLIWVDDLNVGNWTFWFGGGLGSLNFFLGKIPGMGIDDGVAVGFIPGYLMSFGVFGTVLFLWTFLFRFINSWTLPVIVMLMGFYFLVGWNTQVFWFGLMLLRVTFAMTQAEISQSCAPAPDPKSTTFGHRGVVTHR
jgi:hypothetical protein